MKWIKYVPNTLSIMRIVLSPCLLLFAWIDWRLAFVLLYVFIGGTDVFDGKIARKYQVESSLGSKLDAVGDSMLFGCAAVSVFLAGLNFQPQGPLMYILVLLPGVLYKLANVAVTRKRFGEWNMMHTLFNRTVFVSLFFFVPVFIWFQNIYFGMVIGISVVMCLACLEETITLYKIEEYNVGHNGILGAKLLKKTTRG